MQSVDKKIRILRTSTVPGSIETFCNGLLKELQTTEGYEVVVVSSPGEEMETIARREGVRCVAVPMQRHIAPLQDLKSLWGLIKVFRREKPDMVHSITPKAGLLSMMAAWICRVPVRLHTFTGLVFPTAKGIKRKILMFTDRLTCFCATHIVPEGEGVKSDLIKNKITRKPIRVLGHGNVRGIDLRHYDPQLPEVKTEAAKIRKENLFTFVFVGRIVGDKGINELVDAFERLRKEIPSVRLLLVGKYEANLDPISPAASRIIDTDSNIEAVGQQNDVRAWMAAADALVFPSYREGFPNVVIEAGAMGLPAIVTDINGSREIIIEGENGLIIPPRNADALYAAMKEMVINSALRESMASKARKLVADRYEQSYVRRCLKEYYTQILKGK